MNYNIIDEKGTRYVYDYRGFKVAEDEYKPPEPKTAPPPVKPNTGWFLYAVIALCLYHFEKSF